jgi:hypothetical protein
MRPSLPLSRWRIVLRGLPERCVFVLQELLKLGDNVRRLARPDAVLESQVRLDDVDELVRDVVLAAAHAIERDRGSHVQWRHGQHLHEQPLGSRPLRIEAKRAHIGVADVFEDVVDLERRELALAVPRERLARGELDLDLEALLHKGRLHATTAAATRLLVGVAAPREAEVQLVDAPLHLLGVAERAALLVAADLVHCLQPHLTVLEPLCHLEFQVVARHAKRRAVEADRTEHAERFLHEADVEHRPRELDVPEVARAVLVLQRSHSWIVHPTVIRQPVHVRLVLGDAGRDLPVVRERRLRRHAQLPHVVGAQHPELDPVHAFELRDGRRTLNVSAHTQGITRASPNAVL